MITLFAPTSDSNVRSIKSSRACTNTCSHTSSGARRSSISRRLNVNSVFDAEGNPTSISLNPHFTSVWNSSSFWLTFIGTASAWLPSRKSTLHQNGARDSVRLGHCRSGNCTGGNGRYFADGFLSIAISCLLTPSGGQGKKIKTPPPFGSGVHQITRQLKPDCRAPQQQRAR